MAIKTVTFNSIEYRLSYELLNSSYDKSILFLHGWGANKELMKQAFGGCFKEFCHIYLDFPGFGGSSIVNALNSYEVKSITEEFLKAIQKKPQIVIGHSFGGKVALLLNPKNIALLSSTGIVLPKRLWVRVKIRLFKIAKLFGLKRFYGLFASKDVKGMQPVMYEMLKRVVDEDMSLNFKNYEGRASIFWGKSDDITPPICAMKMETFIKNSSVSFLNGDHFFFLDKGKIIETELKKGL
jgi:pimeloyl-ACP methyl ester carboxylesterase